MLRFLVVFGKNSTSLANCMEPIRVPSEKPSPEMFSIFIEKLNGEVNCALITSVLFGPCVGSLTENIFSEMFKFVMFSSGVEPLMTVAMGSQPCAENAARIGTTARLKESRESKIPRTFPLSK